MLTNPGQDRHHAAGPAAWLQPRWRFPIVVQTDAIRIGQIPANRTGKRLVNRVTETFFLPTELQRQSWTLPASIYNLCHTLLARSEFDCAFVPIRSMQYLAVITAGEVVFVDSQAYACREGEGGRLIMLAWQFDTSQQRDALDQPHACNVVYYHPHSAQIQQRLVRDFRARHGVQKVSPRSAKACR